MKESGEMQPTKKIVFYSARMVILVAGLYLAAPIFLTNTLSHHRHEQQSGVGLDFERNYEKENIHWLNLYFYCLIFGVHWPLYLCIDCKSKPDRHIINAHL